jgi:hypothetical protein
MLARVDDIDGNFLAVHRTWLLPDASGKAKLEDQKMSLGPVPRRRHPVGTGRTGAGSRRRVRKRPVKDRCQRDPSLVGGRQRLLQGAAAAGASARSADRRRSRPQWGGEIAARAAGQRWAAEGRHVRLWQSPRVGEDANDLLLKEGKKGMSEQDLSQALNQTEEILPPKPNGEAQPKQPTKEQAKQLIEQRNNFAADIAMLALVKLRDEVGYPIQLREVMKRRIWEAGNRTRLKARLREAAR